MSRTGIVRHPIFLQHDMGPGHPESPARLAAIYRMLDETDMAGRFAVIEARPAEQKEIEMIHTPAYFERLRSTRGRRVQLDPDTSTSAESFDAALMAAGGTMNAVDAVMEGRVSNAFCLHRPPGHHAEADRSSGFCLFNNVAIGAAHALKRADCGRVLICDPDLHHGNGTQHSFYDSRDVLYFSTHQYPYFPGTGDFGEVGRGEGEGFTVNLPMDQGFGDGDFLRIFEDILLPIGRLFRPDLILCSVGADIYEQDPLGAMKVSPAGHGALMERLLSLADEVCDGRFVALLEGGYHLGGLAASIKEDLKVMNTPPSQRERLRADPLREDALERILVQVRRTHAPYWSCFQEEKG